MAVADDVKRNLFTGTQTFNSSVRRSNPYPLDITSSFDTYEQAEVYARNNEAGISFAPYAGQIVSVAETGKVYVLRPLTIDNPNNSFKHYSLDEIQGSTSIQTGYLSKDKDDNNGGHTLTLGGVVIKKDVNGSNGDAIVEGDLTVKGEMNLGQVHVDEMISDNMHGTAGGGNTGSWSLGVGDNGHSQLVVDDALIRGTMKVTKVEVQIAYYVGGMQILTVGGGFDCTGVEDHDDYYRCYFSRSSEKGTIRNMMAVGDNALCQTFDLETGNKYYWRRVVGVGDNYIDLSKTECAANSDVPAAGDVIVHCGNVNPASGRDKVILLSSVDSAATPNAPAFVQYDHLNKFEWPEGDTIISPSGNKFTGNFSANSLKDKDGNDLIQRSDEMKKNLAEINARQDDAFQIHLINEKYDEWSASPSTKEPEVDWKTDEEKYAHLGDFVVTKDGRCLKYSRNVNGYYWTFAEDEYLIAAVTQVKKAQGEIDDMASDMKITPTEKLNLDKMWSEMQQSWESLYAKSSSFDGDDFVALRATAKRWYDGIDGLMEKILKVDGLDTTTQLNDMYFQWLPDVRYTFSETWRRYYENYQSLRISTDNKMKTAIKDADTKAENAKVLVDSIIDDGIIDTTEKQDIVYKLWPAESSFLTQALDKYIGEGKLLSANDDEARAYVMAASAMEKTFIDQLKASISTNTNVADFWIKGNGYYSEDYKMYLNEALDSKYGISADTVVYFRQFWEVYGDVKETLVAKINAMLKETKDTADDAKGTADTAKDKADGAQQTADEANRKVDEKATDFRTAKNVLPSPPYKAGDRWLGANYTWSGGSYIDETLYCIVTKTFSQSPSITDWAPVTSVTRSFIDKQNDEIKLWVENEANIAGTMFERTESGLQLKSDFANLYTNATDKNGKAMESYVKTSVGEVDINAGKVKIGTTAVDDLLVLEDDEVKVGGFVINETHLGIKPKSDKEETANIGNELYLSYYNGLEHSYKSSETFNYYKLDANVNHSSVLTIYSKDSYGISVQSGENGAAIFAAGDVELNRGFQIPRLKRGRTYIGNPHILSPDFMMLGNGEDITLPDASENNGKMIFVKGGGSNKVIGAILTSSSGNSDTSIDIGHESHIFISNGTEWVDFDCSN